MRAESAMCIVIDMTMSMVIDMTISMVVGMLHVEAGG